MRKNIVKTLLACIVTLGFVINGCGVESIVPPPPTPANVNGVAATGSPVRGTISLRDSSVPAKERRTASNGSGAYLIETQGLTAPYILKAEWTEEDGSKRMYSLALKDGKVNINPISHSAVSGASRNGDADDLYNRSDRRELKYAAENMKKVIRELRSVLAPMFELYQTDQDPLDDDFEADHTRLDAMFDDIKITVASGTVTVTNRQTGGVIFTAPVSNIPSGTFFPENMPGTPGQVDGAGLYAAKCSSCHGALATSSKIGATAAQIRHAISEEDDMETLRKLTALQIQAIANALKPGDGTTPEPTPTPTPEPTPTPTPDPTPIDGAALYTQYCTMCHGNSKQGSSATAIQNAISSNIGGMGSFSSLTAEQIQAIADAGITPPPAPAACTYTYSTWGTCQAGGTQTRNLLTTSPSGCTGTPVLSQSCTYVPPAPTACTYTYSTWGTCQADGTQTRNLLTTSPSGCAGTPTLSQTCTYVPPAPACGSCHAIPPANGKHAFHSSRATCATCHGTGYTTTAVTATTHQNGVINIAATPGWNPTTRSCSNSCHSTKYW